MDNRYRERKVMIAVTRRASRSFTVIRQDHAKQMYKHDK